MTNRSAAQSQRGGRSSPFRMSFLLVLVLALVAAACGGGTNGEATDESSPGPATETAAADPTETSDGDVEEITLDDELISAAEAEGEVFLRYSAQEASMNQLIDVFESRYDVTVTAERKVRAEGTELFAQEERAGRHTVDVHFQTDREGNVALAEEGLYAKYTLANEDKFPDETELEPWAYCPFWTDTNLSYNPNNLPTEEAEELLSGTWEGLLDPRFSDGRIALLHPDSGGQGVYWYWALKESPKYGQEFLDKVAAQNPVIVEGSSAGRELVAAGEVDLFIGDVESADITMAAEGAPIRWVYPDILPAYCVVLNFISANAPHPNAARLFTAWLFSEDGAEALLQVGRAPTYEGMDTSTRPTLDNIRDEEWYEPYPAENRFTPPFEEQDEKYLDYLDEMKQTFNIPSL